MTTPEDPEVQDAIRALLRSDPVDIDADRREQAIAAALAAADSSLPTRDATVAPMRARRSPPLRPLLVAAALVLVVAGAAVAGNQWSGSGEDVATGATAATAADARGYTDQESGGADSGGADPGSADSGGGTAESLALARPERATAAALGAFDEVDELLDAAAQAVELGESAPDRAVTTTGAPLRSDATAGATAPECDPARLGTAVASATLSGQPVVVVAVDEADTLIVVALRDCSQVARR